MSKEKNFIQRLFSSAEPESKGKERHLSFNREIGWENPKYDYSKPYVNAFGNRQYVLFGEDNLYPYILLDMYQSSPFHASIIDYKANTILAAGIEIHLPTNTLEEKITKSKIEQKLNEDFLLLFVKQYLIHQRIALDVKKNSDGTVSDFHIIGSEKVREANPDFENDKGYFYNRDWRKRRGGMKEEFIPSYDPFNKKESRQIRVFQSLSPGQDVYAIPSYATAANWIWLDGQIAFFQKQNIENSINPSAVIKLYKNFANPEDEEAYINGLTDSFSSARNAGKVMVFVSDSKETAPDITIADANKLDTAFAGVQTNIVSNVAYAHQINPALMGVATAGKLGATQELIDSYTIFNNVYIKPTQRILSNYLTQVCKMMGVDAKVTIKNNSNIL